jgi:hypothetical protein
MLRVPDWISHYDQKLTTAYFALTGCTGGSPGWCRARSRCHRFNCCAEAFNLPNHLNAFSPGVSPINTGLGGNATLNSSNFGQITSDINSVVAATRNATRRGDHTKALLECDVQEMAGVL